MRSPKLCLLFIAATVAAVSASHAQSVIENGNFENAGDPFKGWITDYAWAGNSNYMANKTHVSIVADGAHKNVVKMDSPGEEGVKMECRAFPLEPGFRYVCNLDVKGGDYRIYFAGYRWAPGVQPHENPELGELRLVYQSKVAQNTAGNAWKQEKLELPGVALSPQALEHLKQVRFLTVYIWFHTPGFVDNVTVTKDADPAMKF